MEERLSNRSTCLTAPGSGAAMFEMGLDEIGGFLLSMSASSV